MRKVGALAAACAVACAAGATGFEVQPGFLIAAEQKSNKFRLVERLKDIKAYSSDATWGNAYTTVRTVWWTDRIIVKKGDEERVIGPYPGAKFYKARWMKSLVVSPPSALGPLRPLRGSRFALSQPDAFGAGESRTGM